MALEYEAAVQAAPDAWMTAGREATAPLRAASDEQPTAFTRLLVAVAREAAWGRSDEQIAGSFEAARESARGIAPDAAPCRLRSPWEALADAAAHQVPDPAAPPGEEDPAAQMERAHGRWAAALAAGPPDAAPAAAGLVADPYRAMAAALAEGDPTREAAERAAAVAASAADAEDALARLIEQGLLAALAAAPWRSRAQEGLAHQAAWPDPLVAHHWTSLVEALDEARTPTEVELLTMHADACFAVERDWNAVFHTVLVAPARAAYLGDPAEAARMATAFTGLGPRALTGTHRAQELIAHCLGGAELGVGREGEAGFELLQAVIATGAIAPPDFGEAPEPLPQPRPARLWGAEIDLSQPFPRPRRPWV